MTEAERDACDCASIGADPALVRQCHKCKRIFRGDKRLISINRVIKAVWPQPETMPAPDVLENAGLRGIEVDGLFSRYVIGKLDRIPAGTRVDVYNPNPPHDGLLQKLMKWFDRQGFKSVESQVLLSAYDYCGVCDLRFDGMLVDLKSVYSLQYTHRLQISGYGWLDGKYPIGLLHVTKRAVEPKLTIISTLDAVNDWLKVLDFYQLVERTK